jgi:multiple sugar transport system permease protein
MRFGQALRYLLGLATILIVIWAFADVAARLLLDEDRSYDSTVTILHWGDPEEERIMVDLVAAFERDHPRVRVRRIDVSAGEYDPKLKTMFAAGDPPDVFYLRPEQTPGMASMGLLMPLDDAFTKAELDQYFPNLLNVFRYDGRRSGAGPLYGLPKDFTTLLMYVNVDLFKRAGVPVPYEGWTWAEYDAVVRKITALSTANRTIYGGMLGLWDGTLLNIIWTFGGDFFGNDFRELKFADPRTQEALEMIRRLRIVDRTVYNPTGIAKDGGQEFLLGNIGVIGPLGRWMTPTYRSITNFEFDVVPLPYKTHRASNLLTNAWAINSRTKVPKESQDLLKYLVGADGQAKMARLGLAIPAMKSVAYSDAFHTPGQKPANSKAFLDAIEFGRIQQFPRESEFRQIVTQVTEQAIQQGTITVPDAAREIERRWLSELDSPLKTQTFAPMRWQAILSIAAAVLATLVTLFWWKARREMVGALDRAQQRAGFGFISPWVIGFVLLTVGPMALSLILAFARWTAITPLADAEFVGGANFVQLVRYDETFGKSLWVTFYFVLLAVPLTQVAALAVALLMNAKVRGITVFRTIYFVPSVVSGVALATLWLKLFNNDFGLINNVFLKPLTWFGIRPPDWFGLDASWAAVPAFVIMGLWGVGGGMVIYLAGLKGVPQSLYEAATIDGAGPLRRLMNVTLPMLSPLIFFNVVMGIIGSFQIFTQAKVMTNGGPGTDTLFYVLNLYRQAFEFHNMGYASAMAWILFVIVLGFTALVFRGSRKMVHYEGLKA